MSTYDKQTKGDVYFANRDKELDELVDPKTGKVNPRLVKKIDCPLCREKKHAILFTKNGFDFVRCPRCGHVYVNPQFREDLAAEHYNDNSPTTKLGQNYLNSPKSLELRQDLYADIFRSLKGILPAKSDVLEIGSSQGHFLKICQDLGHNVLGLELNRAAARYAKKKYGVEVRSELLADCAFKSRSFDLVAMFGLVEHLPDPLEVMRETYRILRPGGVVIGHCPNVASLVCMSLHQLSRTFNGRMHLSYFSDKTLRYLFGRAGFKDKNVTVGTRYTGKDSLINYFQFLDPFGDETTEYLPEKFRKFISSSRGQRIFEEQLHKMGLGLKLVFTARK